MTASKISDDEKIRRMERSRTRFGFSPPKTELGAMSGDQTNDTTRPASNENTQIRSRSVSRKKAGWRGTWVSLFDWRDPATIAMMAVLISWCLLPAGLFYWSGIKVSSTSPHDVAQFQTVPADSDFASIKEQLETLIAANENLQNVELAGLKNRIDKLVTEITANSERANKFIDTSEKQLARIEKRIPSSVWRPSKETEYITIQHTNDNSSDDKDTSFRKVIFTAMIKQLSKKVLPTLEMLPKEKLEVFHTATLSLTDNAKSDEEKKLILSSLGMLLLIPKNDDTINPYLEIKNLPKEKSEVFSAAVRSLTEDAKSDEEKKLILLSLGALLIAPENHFALTPDLEKFWATLIPDDTKAQKRQ